jgi:PBP1b-binding outer membrane lipoprotein LpoB
VKNLVFIIAILVFFNGCSSSEQTNGANPNAPNSANANSAAAINANPPGAMQPYNGVQNLSPNAFNATNDNLKVIPVKPNNNQSSLMTRSAPDDSTVTSGSRGLLFFEARTFNNHPVLAKVEKIMDGKTSKYKVYLKNGKTLDAPAEKMENYLTLAPENILDAVGMLPKPQTNSQVKPVEKKDPKQ